MINGQFLGIVIEKTEKHITEPQVGQVHYLRHHSVIKSCQLSVNKHQNKKLLMKPVQRLQIVHF